MKIKSIQTKYGTVTEKNGWYYISSNEHGHRGKALHRVIFEDYHRCTLLPEANIHHKNFDKHDNRIENLELLSASEHQKYIKPCINLMSNIAKQLVRD